MYAIMILRKVKTLDLPHSRKVTFQVTPLEQGRTRKRTSPLLAYSGGPLIFSGFC